MPDLDNEETALMDSGKFQKQSTASTAPVTQAADEAELPTAAGIDDAPAPPAVSAPRFRGESAAAAQKLPWALFAGTLILWLLTVLGFATKLSNAEERAENEMAERGKLDARNKTLTDKLATLNVLEEEKERLSKELDASRERVRTLEAAKTAAATPAAKKSAPKPVVKKKAPVRRR